MAKRALYFHSCMAENLRIREAVCYDGLENFASSQYDINNIQQAIGRDSLYIYDFNFASMNRKGRTSVWQKQRLRQIENKYGRYDPQAIRKATKTLLERLYKKCDPRTGLLLLSDEHFHYRQALCWDLPDLPIEHRTVSSKACRNFQNILFSVNHADLMIRQRLAAFARETISFSKSPGAMCQKYALFLVHKNYMIPQFTKEHVRRPEAHLRSPAEHLGICKKLLEFGDVFDLLPNKRDKKQLNPEWQCFWNSQVPETHHRNKRFVRNFA